MGNWSRVLCHENADPDCMNCPAMEANQQIDAGRARPVCRANNGKFSKFLPTASRTNQSVVSTLAGGPLDSNVLSGRTAPHDSDAPIQRQAA
jgi:hypothetical protein